MTTRRRRAARRFLRHMPTILITDTFQVMLAVGMILMGIAAIGAMVIGESGAIERTLPSLALRTGWATALLLGGGAQLLGLQWASRAPDSHGPRRLERLGLNLGGLGCTVYALTLLNTNTAVGRFLGFAFLFWALGYFIRVLLSNLARGIREERARDAHG